MGFAPLPQIVFTCKLPPPSLCEASLILRFYESYGMWMGRYVSMREGREGCMWSRLEQVVEGKLVTSVLAIQIQNPN